VTIFSKCKERPVKSAARKAMYATIVCAHEIHFPEKLTTTSPSLNLGAIAVGQGSKKKIKRTFDKDRREDATMQTRLKKKPGAVKRNGSRCVLSLSLSLSP
jgi:hypothetical protein